MSEDGSEGVQVAGEADDPFEGVLVLGLSLQSEQHLDGLLSLVHLVSGPGTAMENYNTVIKVSLFILFII